MSAHEPLPEPRRRFLARPRQFGRGLLLSIAFHAGLALVFVVVWSLLPLPPIQPIRIYALPHAPSRSEIGVQPDGKPGPGFGAEPAPTTAPR